ncbi:hypothetical protein BDQ17DRAFT_720049 [Cyathus striatus]|nr:hypothetical protein BDQ17DRAFT_720049 [Cyathus striatus]
MTANMFYKICVYSFSTCGHLSAPSRPVFLGTGSFSTKRPALQRDGTSSVLQGSFNGLLRPPVPNCPSQTVNNSFKKLVHPPAPRNLSPTIQHSFKAPIPAIPPNLNVITSKGTKDDPVDVEEADFHNRVITRRRFGVNEPFAASTSKRTSVPKTIVIPDFDKIVNLGSRERATKYNRDRTAAAAADSLKKQLKGKRLRRGVDAKIQEEVRPHHLSSPQAAQAVLNLVGLSLKSGCPKENRV